MKNCLPSEKGAVEALFSDSIYQNRHLGWLDLWDLPGIGGSVRLFGDKSFQCLIAVQPVADKVCWLHSFYCSSRPSPELYFIRALKTFFTEGTTSVFTISSHRWYSDLLERNGFKQCDEIIEYETDRIMIPHADVSQITSPLPDSMITSVMENCETAFPVLWRLSKKELETAFSDADYRQMIGDTDHIHAYIMADLSDRHCHILRLASNPGYQHQGFATGLVRRMVSDCEEKGITTFSVKKKKKNSAATDFYRALNFIQLEKVYPVYHRYL